MKKYLKMKNYFLIILFVDFMLHEIWYLSIYRGFIFKKKQKQIDI